MELTSVFFWYVSLYNFLIQFFLRAFSLTSSNLLRSWPFDPIHIWTLPPEPWSSFTMVTVMYSILVLEKTADYFNLWWTVPPTMYRSKIKLIHLPVHWSILRFMNLNYEKINYFIGLYLVFKNLNDESLNNHFIGLYLFRYNKWS